jgi:hypothetical protein
MDDTMTPQTMAVKQEILRHRFELQDTKDAYSIKAVSPAKTPKTVSFEHAFESTPTHGVQAGDDDSLADIIMYKNSALSFLVVIVGSLGLSLAHFVLRGDHGLTVLSGKLMAGCMGTRRTHPVVTTTHPFMFLGCCSGVFHAAGHASFQLPAVPGVRGPIGRPAG